MFLLKTNEKNKVDFLRKRLMAQGEPCAAYTMTEFDSGVTDDKLCVVCDEPNFAMQVAEAVRGMQVILYSGRTVPLASVHAVLPCQEGPEQIYRIAQEIMPDTSVECRAGTVYFMEGVPRFFGSELYLTQSEVLLVRYLARNRGKYMPAARLAAYCLRADDHSVPVHIHNINRKTKELVGRPLIECRRYRGYRVE